VAGAAVLFFSACPTASNTNLAHHDHAGPAAEGFVVHRLMVVGGEIANVGQVVFHQPLFRGPLGDAGVPRTGANISGKRVRISIRSDISTPGV